MNLLFVADVSIANVIGGAERVLYKQCTMLAARGHSVHVLTRTLPIHHQRVYDKIDGVHEWRYRVDFDNPAVFLWKTLRNGRKLFERLHRQHRFRCLHFHQPVTAFGVIQSPEASGPYKIYTCHSLAFEEYQTRNRKPRGMAAIAVYRAHCILRRWIERAVLRASDQVVVLSDFTRNKLIGKHGLPPRKIVIAPGGVDMEKFRPASDNRQARARLGLHPEKIILLTVRNLVPRMGLENLIAAFAKTAGRVSDIELIIGGDGPLRKKLMRLADGCGVTDQIHFAGFIPENLLPVYYQASDCFILPTRELEGFGLVTLEAMASGVPVVGTPVGGTLEILRRFDKNFLFEDTGPDAIAKKVIEKCRTIRNDPTVWADISAGCRRFVEQNYSWDRHIDTLEKIFRSRPNCGSDKWNVRNLR